MSRIHLAAARTCCLSALGRRAVRFGEEVTGGAASSASFVVPVRREPVCAGSVRLLLLLPPASEKERRLAFLVSGGQQGEPSFGGLVVSLSSAPVNISFPARVFQREIRY